MNRTKENYVGVHHDDNGGLTDAGRIVRDAWVFGLIPETEDGAGWSRDRIQELYDKVHEAWAPYGHLVSRLPPELRERHQRIYAQAVAMARDQGWDPAVDLEDEH